MSTNITYKNHYTAINKRYENLEIRDPVSGTFYINSDGIYAFISKGVDTHLPPYNSLTVIVV